jgi:hypothetical protein
MALLWIDGFDAYSPTSGTVIETVLNQQGYIVVDPNTTDLRASNVTQSGIGFSLDFVGTGTLTLPFGNSPGVIVGFRFNSPVALGTIFELKYNNLLGVFTTQLVVWLNDQNGISVGTQDGDILASTPVNSVLTNTWYYLELLYVPSPTNAGTVKLRIDGVELITISATKTAFANIASTVGQVTSSLVNQISFNWVGGEFSPGAFNVMPAFGGSIDDFYLLDTTGTLFNTFLGDVVVHAVFPASDAGTNTMSQVGGGAGHFTSVKEVAPDGDSSYVFGSTSGLKELYTVSTLPADIIDVLAVSVDVMARKAAIGDGSYESALVYNTVEVDSQAFPAASSYTATHFIVTTPPGGGSWTLSLVQSAKIGFKLP